MPYRTKKKARPEQKSKRGSKAAAAAADAAAAAAAALLIDMPPEIFGQILQRLPLFDRCRALATCRSWRAAADGLPSAWADCSFVHASSRPELLRTADFVSILRRAGSQLQCLKLQSARNIDEAAVEELRGCKSLQRVAMPSCSQMGSKAFAVLTQLPSLEEIDVARWKIDDRDLPGIRNLTRLKMLDLSYCDVTTPCLREHLPHTIEFLRLEECDSVEVEELELFRGDMERRLAAADGVDRVPVIKCMVCYELERGERYPQCMVCQYEFCQDCYESQGGQFCGRCGSYKCGECFDANERCDDCHIVLGVVFSSDPDDYSADSADSDEETDDSGDDDDSEMGGWQPDLAVEFPWIFY